MAPGASKPSKLLLQYPIEVPLGVTARSLSLELDRIALTGASAYSYPSFDPLPGERRHLVNLGGGRRRGRVYVLRCPVGRTL